MFLKLSLDKFGFQQILDDFEKTSNISILTYNISTNKNRLLDILKKLEGKKIVIITNIPQRWERYFFNDARKKACIQIEEYLKLLDPSSFKSNVEVYFNFKNHAKVYSTDSYTYVGSQNFSDESKNNYEAGIIMTNNSGEELVEDLKEESIRFFGVEIETIKTKLKNEIRKIQKYIEKFRYDIDFEIVSGTDYLEEVKSNFSNLILLLEMNIKKDINQIKDEISTIKEKYNLEDIHFIDNSLSKLENIDEVIDEILWEISPRGDFSEVYFDYNLQAMDNVSYADEEHLESALINQMRNMEDICSDIKERYEETISNYFYDLNRKFNCIIKLSNTIEEMTSNRDKINNTRK